MKEKILEAIENYNTIIIHRHVRPDPDAYGSQGGLAELIKTSYPNKKVYVVGEEDENLLFLNRMDEIPDDVYKNALVIVCDTANRERISDQRYTLGETLIKIDHHPNHEPYGDIMWVDTDASSVSEMIYELYTYGKEKNLTLSERGAALIYMGIVGDTGRFLYANTTEKTLKIASEIIGRGIDAQRYYNQLYEIKPNVAKLKGYVLQNFALTDRGVASFRFTKELLAQYQVKPNDTSQFTGILGELQGVKAWVFFVEEEKQIRVRFRSKGAVINGIASKYGGGGHPLSAGGTIYSWDEADSIISDLNELVSNE